MDNPTNSKLKLKANTLAPSLSRVKAAAINKIERRSSYKGELISKDMETALSLELKFLNYQVLPF